MSANPAQPETAPRERYRGERVALLNKVPVWARRVVVVGTRVDMVCAVLKRAWNMPVCAVECDPEWETKTAPFVEQMHSGDALQGPCPFPESHADVLLALDLPKSMDSWVSLLNWSESFLASDGMGILLLWESLSCPPLPALIQIAEDAGYRNYQTWVDPLMPESRALVKFVNAEYCPVECARRLHAGGNPDAAYNELMEIPQVHLDRKGITGEVHALALQYLAEVALTFTADSGQDFLLRGQIHYTHTTCHAPGSVLAAESYARILQQSGAPELAYEVRDSFKTAYPHCTGVGMMERPQIQHADSWSALMSSNFAWPGNPPRILFLTSTSPHYGLDLLYDGLCICLGDEQVIEWPYKSSLHGAPMHSLAQYPCSFDWHAKEYPFEAILAMLNERAFDFVLLGDCDVELPIALLAQLLQAARAQAIPIALVDAVDECVDMRPRVIESLGGYQFSVYFKREMARFIDYGPCAVPLPFSYSRSKIRPHGGPRDKDFFWAGTRQFGLRRLYLEHLEIVRRMDLRTTYPPDVYAELISTSRVGLSLFGKGYDTVRYWELPAHGCMLLSERPPIHVPHNFVDGESAIFFDSLRDLLEKLDHYRAHPEETSRIALAGEQHYLAHHTSEARARQLLHILFERCIRNPA